MLKPAAHTFRHHPDVPARPSLPLLLILFRLEKLNRIVALDSDHRTTKHHYKCVYFAHYL